MNDKAKEEIARKLGGTYPDILIDLYVMNEKKPAELCELFGMSMSGVMRHLRKSKVFYERRRILTREEIIEIYNCNLSLNKAKEKYKIGASTYYEICTGFYKGKDVCSGILKKPKKPETPKKTEYVECLCCSKKNIKKVHRDEQNRICKRCKKINHHKRPTEYHRSPLK